MKFCKCGKKLTKNIYTQCQKCFLSMRKGENHPQYIKTKIRNCIDCGKKLHMNTIVKNHTKCKSCCQKGDLNPHNRPENRENFSKIMSKVHKGKTISKRMRKSLSLINSGKGNPMFGKITHGKGAYYNSIWMRSSYEIVFAKWCDKNNINWAYESKTFDLGNTTYTPDFYLPEFNLYIEVKGYWREDAKIKFEEFKQRYCGERIMIINEEILKQLGEI